MRKKEKKAKKKQKNMETRWDKLDNTANLFPVIASESMTNVYRISAILSEEVDGGQLQKALELVLPWFDIFKVRLRRGVFWYYFETNQKAAPRVIQENTYPCRFIEMYRNNNYLFRVSYYKKKINLEVFHAVTDGVGGIAFLRELVYQYLRLIHSGLAKKAGDGLSCGTSLNKEDSYLKNYKRSHVKTYKSRKAVHIKGELLKPLEFGVIHGSISLPALKEVCKRKKVTLNQYLTAVFTYAIYTEYLHGMPSKKPVSICVPVNLRPFFGSITTKNFFAMVSAMFHPVKDEYSFDEVLKIVADSLSGQITKENLSDILSYNVSNEKNLILRWVPLFIKNIAMKRVYSVSAMATTTTLTNIGKIEIAEVYQPYIEQFHAILAMSKGQNIKAAVSSYRDTLVVTFSSILVDTSIQRAFFCQIAKEGVPVSIQTNGVYYDAEGMPGKEPG